MQGVACWGESQPQRSFARQDARRRTTTRDGARYVSQAEYVHSKPVEDLARHGIRARYDLTGLLLPFQGLPLIVVAVVVRRGVTGTAALAFELTLEAARPALVGVLRVEPSVRHALYGWEQNVATKLEALGRDRKPNSRSRRGTKC